MADTYEILGIHDDKVTTVEGNVARVRMVIDGQTYDDDIPLPKVKTLEELLDEAVAKRMEEIKGGAKPNV